MDGEHGFDTIVITHADYSRDRERELPQRVQSNIKGTNRIIDEKGQKASSYDQ